MNFFNLNLRNFMKSSLQILINEATAKAKKEEVTISKREIGDIRDYPMLMSTDLAYGKIWYYDKNQQKYYQEVNGKKRYYEDAEFNNPGTCYTTYLKDKSPKCERVISCILKGDFSTLKDCLKVLEDEDFWDVAKDDFKNVHPSAIKLILHKFGVDKKKVSTDRKTGTEYYRPMSFNEWKKKIQEDQKLDKKVKETILSKPKILDYIQGLINIVQKNPSILNPGVSVPSRISSRIHPAPAYFDQLKIKEYKIPIPTNQAETMNFASNVLTNTFPQTSPSDYLTNLIMSGMTRNATFGQQPFLPMFGGQGQFYMPYGNLRGFNKMNPINQKGLSANMFANLYDYLNTELESIGFKLDPKDKEKIIKTTKNLKTLEEDLAQLAAILSGLVTFARNYGIQYGNIEKENLIKLPDFDTIASKEDLVKFVKSHIQHLQENIMSNMMLQQNISSDLRFGVFPNIMQAYVKMYKQKQEPKEEIKSTAEGTEGFVDILTE